MQPGPIAIGWLIAGALLFAEHMGMWEKPWRLDTPWNYLVGVLTLFVGWIAWGMTASGPITPIDAVANISAVTSAGAIVIICYAVRKRLDHKKEHTKTVQEAKALTQAIIDQGDGYAARQPDLRDPGRRN